VNGAMAARLMAKFWCLTDGEDSNNEVPSTASLPTSSPLAMTR
jgi:uncharacterized protein affecting Mg2+/Co2+ transport